MADYNETQSTNASVEILRLIKAPLGIFAACLILLFGTLDLVALSSDSTNFKLVLLANLAIILIVALLALFRPEALAGTRRETPIDESALISPYETQIEQLMKVNDQLKMTVRTLEERVTTLDSDLMRVTSLRSQICFDFHEF